MAEVAEKMEPQNTLLQLETLKERDFSEVQTQILDVLAYAINAATDEAATEAAIQLDALCPPLDQYPDAQDYMWAIWEIIMDAAESHDVTNEIQEGMIRTLQALQQIAKGDMDIYGGDGFKKRVWRDLPVLPVCFEASFNDPTSDSAKSELTPKSAQMWRNINRFGARFFSGGLLGPYSQAIHALRLALEDEPSPVPEVAECRLRVACDWVFYGASPLLLWAQENIGYTDVPEDDTAAFTPGGVLYKGPQTMCLLRWGFWMQRFEEFGKMEGSGLSEEAKGDALKAVEIMRT
ncbi:hypothetical protein diail_5658, partial [Diaporthe ilicicola]